MAFDAMTMNTTISRTLRAMRDDEVCPLCLSRYAAAMEQICVSCEAPSCPECVEHVEGTALCFACHGPLHH